MFLSLNYLFNSNPTRTTTTTTLAAEASTTILAWRKGVALFLNTSILFFSATSVMLISRYDFHLGLKAFNIGVVFALVETFFPRLTGKVVEPKICSQELHLL